MCVGCIFGHIRDFSQFKGGHGPSGPVVNTPMDECTIFIGQLTLHCAHAVSRDTYGEGEIFHMFKSFHAPMFPIHYATFITSYTGIIKNERSFPLTPILNLFILFLLFFWFPSSPTRPTMWRRSRPNYCRSTSSADSFGQQR